MLRHPLTAIALSLALAPVLAAPAAAQELTPDEVKRLALEAILENPEIILEAVAIVREREEADKRAATEAAIAEMRAALEQDPNAPVLGNPEGDVTIVEFFDYNCPYCKQASAEVKALIEADPNIRLVYREWPVLGEGSLFAARAALAAREQDGYAAFHDALMTERARKDAAAVLRIAAEVGLDVERLEADMAAEAVDEHLARSSELAQRLGFTGTPSFVIGEQGLFGFAEAAELAAMVAEARNGAPVK